MPMTLAEIGEFARYLYGPITEHDASLWDSFINEGLDILCDITGCLDDVRELCLVNGAVSEATSVTVDAPGSKYLAIGDVIDFLTSGSVEDSGTISSVDSATAITMAAAVTVSNDAEIYYQNSHGVIDIVEDQAEYIIPRGIVLKQDQREPFELYFCKDASTERKLTFTSAERLAYLYGPGWRIKEGSPTHYYMRGTANFGTFPVYGSNLSEGLKAKWARRARPLIDSTDVPEAPARYHRGFSYFAAGRMAEVKGLDPARVDRLMAGFTQYHASLADAVRSWRNQGQLVVPQSGT